MLHIVPVYASILALFYILLSIQTIRKRAKLKIGIGDGGNHEMMRAMRVHSNFAEYVPLALILISMIELNQGSSMLIHALCGMLLLGRFMHAYGVSHVNEKFVFRMIGMPLTFFSLGISAIYLLFNCCK